MTRTCVGRVGCRLCRVRLWRGIGVRAAVARARMEEERVQQTIYDQLGEPDPVVTDWGVKDRAGAVTWVREGREAAQRHVFDRRDLGHHAQLVTRRRTAWEDAE